MLMYLLSVVLFSDTFLVSMYIVSSIMYQLLVSFLLRPS